MKGQNNPNLKEFTLIMIVFAVILFSSAFTSQCVSSPQVPAAQSILPFNQEDSGASGTAQSHSLDIPTPTISANAPPSPKKEKVLVLRAQLNGSIFTVNINDMKTLFVDSVEDYYNDDSYNQVYMNTTFLTNNYTLPGSESYYSSLYHIEDLIADTLTAAEKDVSHLGGYSVFRHIIIVHSGTDRAVTQSPTDIGSEFINGTSGSLFEIGGVNIMNACIVSQYDPLGVVVHELGHSQGLPDLYSYQAETQEPPEGDVFVGAWDLMATGAWSPNNQGTSPCYMTTWCKIKLGWINAAHIVSTSQSAIQSGANETVFLDPQETLGQNLAIRIMLNNGTYFLIEDRQAIGYDTSIPASGILILFCDDSQPTGYGPVKVMSAHPPDLGADAVFNVGFLAKDFYSDPTLNIGVKVLDKWDNGTFKVLVGQLNSTNNAPTEYKDVTVPVIFGIAIIAVISMVSVTVYAKKGRRKSQAGQQIPVIKLS